MTGTAYLIKQSCCCSLVQLCSTLYTLWTATLQVYLSFTISQCFLKLMSIESVMPSNRVVACWPLLLLSSIFPSIRIYFKELVFHIRWPNFGVSISASVLPMNIQFISFRIGWLDLLLSKEISKVFSNTTV